MTFQIMGRCSNQLSHIGQNIVENLEGQGKKREFLASENVGKRKTTRKYFSFSQIVTLLSLALNNIYLIKSGYSSIYTDSWFPTDNFQVTSKLGIPSS